MKGKEEKVEVDTTLGKLMNERVTEGDVIGEMEAIVEFQWNLFMWIEFFQSELL